MLRTLPHIDASSKPRLRRVNAVVAAAGAFVVLGVAGAGWWHARMHRAAQYVPPVFVDPPPGPRAPSADIFGVRIGASHLADVKRLMTTAGVACEDRSVRTMMGELRAHKREEIRVAEARGKPDTVSGASILTRHTARDDNPQIRFACADVASDELPDRTRAPSTGRVLFVFDTKDAPARHASYERNDAAWETAIADFNDTRAALRARFGAPADQSSAAAGASPDASAVALPLPKYSRRVAEWRFSDLLVRVSLSNLGGRGFSVSEVMEVPWPVRANAPAH
jgi:hypothetical protein